MKHFQPVSEDFLHLSFQHTSKLGTTTARQTMNLSKQKVYCLARILFVSIFHCTLQAVPYLLVYDPVFETSLRNNNVNCKDTGNSRHHRYELIEKKSFTSLTQLERNRTVFSLSTSFEFFENNFLEHYGFGTSLEDLVSAYLAIKFLENSSIRRAHLYSMILETCCRSSRPKVFVEKLIRKIPQNSQEIVCNGVDFLQALNAGPATFHENELHCRHFPVNFQDSFSKKHPRTTTAVRTLTL